MNAKFEAVISGNPKPKVTWFFEGEEIENSRNVQIRSKANRVYLTLIDCGLDMAGYYSCKVTNDLGSNKCRASLTVAKALDRDQLEKRRSTAGMDALIKAEEEKMAERQKIKDEKIQKQTEAKAKTQK